MALRSTDQHAEEPPESGRPTVAAFDFDGTLADGGSVFPFLVSLRGWWPVVRAVVRLSPSLVHAAIAGVSTTQILSHGIPVRKICNSP